MGRSLRGDLLHWNLHNSQFILQHNWLRFGIITAAKQEEKGMTEDEMVGWHHWLRGHKFEQALGDGEGQGSLACRSPWDYRVGHNWVMTPMYGCESKTIKKAEHWRIDAFELWCGKRLLRVPWTEKRSNQSILKEINLEYSLEGRMLKLKLQYFGHLMQRAVSLAKTLMVGKTEGRGERDDIGWDCWMVSLTQWTRVWANSGRWWRTGKPGVPQSTGSHRVRHHWATEQQQYL